MKKKIRLGAIYELNPTLDGRKTCGRLVRVLAESNVPDYWHCLDIKSNTEIVVTTKELWRRLTR